MFDFLRNLTKSAGEKRQETVAAYVDEALSARARQQFEQEMSQDEALRQEVEQLQLIKQSLRQLPQREVPRNFILDPAQYGRPVRQPWVQAYPVLRAATAMTAFFLIFAFAAGIFTNFGANAEPVTSAPAADVAQVEESVAVTRVVTEVTETLAFEAEAEVAADQAEELVVEEEAMAEEEAEEMDTEEEMADEETADEAEAPPAPEATAVPSAIDSLQEEETMEDGATEPVVQPTATVTALPTPTVSTLPRVTPPTPLPDRDMDQAVGGEAANDAIADVPETEDDTTTAETTAVLSEEDVKELENARPLNLLLILQIGLGVLLLLLAGLTFYARRQR